MPSSPPRPESALITAIFVALAILVGVVFASIAGLGGLIVAAPAYLVFAAPYSMLAYLLGWPRLKSGIFGELFGIFGDLFGLFGHLP